MSSDKAILMQYYPSSYLVCVLLTTGVMVCHATPFWVYKLQ